MISALLLPLLFSDVPAKTVGTTQDDPPIQVWISNDRRFLPGDRAKVQVRTNYDGYLVVLHVDPEGRLRVLFPVDPDNDNFVRSGKKYEVRDRGGRTAFEVDATGRGSVYAAVSRDPFRFDGFILSDHWDYRAMAPARLREDPEPELNELVQRMAQGSYDYDVLSYDVISRSAYASSSSRYYGSLYEDGWCRFSCGRPYFGHSGFGLSIGLFSGRPYRHYYYDPYYYAYNPYFNPFFYDPYYYAPSYYPRYTYPGGHYGYGGQYYRDRYPAYNRPYTPYRFRGSDGFSAGYRDRGQGLGRAVNTVYIPPLSRIREPVARPVVRRVTDDGADLPNGLAPRRAGGYENRVQPKPIEGRRARQAETPQRETTPSRRVADDRPVIRREQPQTERTRVEPRRVERAREEPRRVERSAPEARPQHRGVERSSPRPQVRSSGGSYGRGAGGGGSMGGGHPSHAGGVRRH